MSITIHEKDANAFLLLGVYKKTTYAKFADPSIYQFEILMTCVENPFEAVTAGYESESLEVPQISKVFLPE